MAQSMGEGAAGTGGVGGASGGAAAPASGASPSGAAVLPGAAPGAGSQGDPGNAPGGEAGAEPRTAADALRAAIGGVGKTPDGAPSQAPATQAAPGAPAGADPKGAGKTAPKDDADFAPPQGLSGDASARFAKLVERTKAVEGEASKYRELAPQFERMRQDVEDLRWLMREAQAGPEDLTNMLGIIRMMKTGDHKGARDALLSMVKDLGLETGEEQITLDPLSDYQDLLDSVEDQRLTRAHATELARLRKRDAAIKQQRQREQETQRSTKEIQQEINSEIARIQAWGAQLQANDIDFIHKKDQLLGMIDEVTKDYPPNLWLRTLQSHYKLIKSTERAAPAGGEGGPRPLRPQGAGGMHKEPTSALEALQGVLGPGS